MLVVYSAHGSPGASTTAMYLAAQWASTGTEVLLVEADPAGGSLSHHLGIQFTPGLASFVASGLEVRGGHLVDHSQDVLFNNLHVMPATSSPTGARQIVRWLDDHAEEFRAVAEADMAVIIDGGRVTADSAAAALTGSAAGVVVVARGDTSATSLEHLGGLLSAEACGEGVERCVVTVGDSPLGAEEWEDRCGITFCGAIQEFAEVRGDLAAFLNRNKRKSKKWRLSLEAVAEALLPFAKPAASEPSRPRRAKAADAEEPEAEAAAPPQVTAEPGEEHAAADGPAPDDTGAHEPAAEDAGQHDDGEVPVGAGYAEAPQPQTEPYYGSAGGEYGEGPPPQPYFPSVSAADQPPPPPDYGQYPPEQQPVYFEPLPAPPEPAYYDAPLPVYDPPPPPQHPYQPQGYPQQPAAPQHPPPGYPPQPPAPQQPPHGYPQPAHGQVPAYQQPPAAPPYPYEPQQSPYQQAAPPHPASQPPQPPHQPPQSPYQQGAPPEEPAEREIAPSGSFRDWAARLHGHAPADTPTQGHGGVS